MKLRRLGWMVLAAGFLGLAGFLTQLRPDAPGLDDTERHHAPIVFPRDQRLKSSVRRRGPGPLATMRAADDPPTDAPPDDRLERALGGLDGSAVVVEVNAIRHAPIAERLLACGKRSLDEALAPVVDELGIDVLEDVDRFAFTDDVMVASGFFDKLKIPPELGAGEALGEADRLYVAADDQGKPMAVGVAGDDLVVIGSDEDVRQALARLHDDTPVNTRPDDVVGAPGEVYGTLTPRLLARLWGQTNPALAERAQEMIERGVLRMNIDEHVAVSLDVRATSEQDGRDLAQALAGGLAALRMKAAHQGDEDAAKLLETAKVRPYDDGTFDVDVAISGDTLLEWVGCGPAGSKRAAEADQGSR